MAERELRERQQLERRHVSGRYKAQCDLLPGIGGQVLTSKASRDGSSGAAPAPAPAPVSVLAKGGTGYLVPCNAVKVFSFQAIIAAVFE